MSGSVPPVGAARAVPFASSAAATSAEYAHAILRDDIVALRLAPGSPIREEALARELDIGRRAVHDALLRLASERLVVSMPPSGMFVSDANAADVSMVYELRRDLEASAAGWAATRRRAADLPEIDTMIAVLDAEERDGTRVDARAQTSTDQRAHFLIYRLAANPVAENVLQSLFFLSARIWSIAAGRVSMHDPFDDLIRALAAVKRGDAVAAAEFARLHNEHAERVVRGAL